MKYFVATLSLLILGAVIYYWFPGIIIQTGIRVLRRWAGLKRYVVTVDDHRWVYLAGGKGETILFVHGFGADKDRWGPILKRFCGPYRLIVPDIPGFGENSRIDSADYSIPSQVKRLRRFCEVIGLKSFHLLGVSMGGYMAAYFASEYPAQVKSLALIAPAGVKSDVRSHLWKRYEADGRNLLLYRTPEELDELLSVVFHNPPWLPRSFKAYFAQQGAATCSFSEKVLVDVLRDGLDLLESRLPRVMVRTLLLWGANDRVLDVSSVKKFQSGLKDSSTLILHECGHTPHLEKPEEVERAYKEFLASVS